MAHRLNVEDGKASMMYVGRPPWHGLGQNLEKPPTASEAIKAAGLDWEVRKQQLFIFEGDVVYPVDDKFAIVPAHKWGKPECPIFGLVGRDYAPLQNRDAFGFFDPILEEAGATYETAGALDDGSRIWVMAKLPGEITVVSGDPVDRFLLLQQPRRRERRANQVHPHTGGLR